MPKTMQVAEMAELCDGEVIFYSRRAAIAPRMVAHRHGAGAPCRAAGKAMCADPNGEQLGANIDLSACCRVMGASTHAGQSCEAPGCGLLAAVAAAWALGISPELISAGLDPNRSSPANSRSANTMEKRSFLASAPCVAPISGAATPPSRPSSSARPSARHQHCPASKTGCARCSRPSAHCARPRPDHVSLAHVLEQAALALQAQAGCPVTFSRTHRTGRRALPGGGRVQRRRRRPPGRQARRRSWCGRAGGTPRLAMRPWPQLREMDEDVRLGPSPAASSTPQPRAACPTAA
jgi:hypothetical protein